MQLDEIEEILLKNGKNELFLEGRGSSILDEIKNKKSTVFCQIINDIDKSTEIDEHNILRFKESNSDQDMLFMLIVMGLYDVISVSQNEEII